MRRSLLCSAVFIAVFVLPLAEAWFALTKEGYRVKGNLTNEGHLLVIDNIKLEGVFILGQNNSESGLLDGMNQKCDALKEGALRYNNTHVEGCKQNRWRPLAFCDYECRPRDDVPCGALVYSSCGDRITTGFYCEGMFGLGLNLAQCSLNTNATSCGDPVYDDCGNFCGTEGVLGCTTTEMKRYVGLDILPVQCPSEPSFARDDWIENQFDDSAWARPTLVSLNIEQCESCSNCSNCSSCNSPGKSPPTRFNEFNNCSACINCPDCSAHKNLLKSLYSTRGNTVAVASATLWPYYPQFDAWTPWIWSSDYRKHDLVYFRMNPDAMYYPITAKASDPFSLYINGSLCALCSGTPSAPVSINASVARGWDIITLISTAAASSFSLVLAGQVITPDLIRCASLVSPTSLTFDTINWTNPSPSALPATTSVRGSLLLPDIYFAPATLQGATATVCQLVAPRTMKAELSCDRDFDIFVKGQWAGKGGGKTEPDSPLASNAGAGNVNETWKFDLEVIGRDVVSLQARSLAFGGCIGIFGGVPMSNLTWKVAHFGNSDHTNSNYNTLNANNQSSQASGSCLYSTRRRGLVANGPSLVPKSSQQSARPSYRKSAPPPGVDGSTNLYRIVQHGVGGLLFQSGNITVSHSKISDRLINNLTNIRSGVGIVKRTYNISTVMEMTPVLGLGVRLEGVSDDDGGELILGSPLEVRNSRVIVDGDMWSTEDVFLGNGMEDTVSFGGRINGSRSLALQGAHWSSKDTLTLTLPHLGGADAAVRSYLINEAPSIPIRADHSRWGSVLYPITSLVLNPQVCCAIARGLNVASFQNLTSFLVNNSLVVMDPSGSTPRVDLSILDGNHPESQFFDLKTRLMFPSPANPVMPRSSLSSPSLLPATMTPLRPYLNGDVKTTCSPSSPRTMWNRDWNKADSGFPCVADPDAVAAASSECDDTWVRSLLKCAALQWLPSQVDYGSELVLPEASGTLLSTGNLADITVDSGYMTGVAIKRELVVDGSAVLGSASAGTSTLRINAAIVGQAVFSLRGQSNAASETRIEVQDPSLSQQVLTVPDSDGTIITSGSSAILSGAFVVGPFESSGSFNVQSSNITLGVNHTLDTLTVNAGIVEGLSFEGHIVRNGAVSRLMASEPSSGENQLHLPDVSGTILVAGGSASVISDVTVSDSTHLQGSIVIDGSVVLSNASSVQFAATISGAHALTFDAGLGTAARSTLSIETPSTSSSTQWLPDADGTILMSSQAAPLEKLTVTDSLYSNGASIFNGQISFGEGLPTTVSFQQSVLLGAYPLTFESADASGKTLTLHTPTLGSDVVITLPDTSGTLLTALPSTWAADDNLAVVAPAVNINVGRIALGAALASNSAPNSFAFSDASDSLRAQEGEFAVLATGGVRMCTSASPSRSSPPLEPSVELLAGDVLWRSRYSNASVLNLTRVNETQVLNAVSSFALVHSWSFAASPSSSHIGPLPQEWAHVLSSLQIPSVSSDTIAAADVDGVLLASVRELSRRLVAAEQSISVLQGQLSQLQEEQSQQMPLPNATDAFEPSAVRIALCINDTSCESALGCSGSEGSDEQAQVVAVLGVCTPVDVNETRTGHGDYVSAHSIMCSDCVNGRATCTWYGGDSDCFGPGVPLALKARDTWVSDAGAGVWAAGVCATTLLPYSHANDRIRATYRGICMTGGS